MQLSVEEDYSYGRITEMLEDEDNKDLRKIFFDLYKDEINQFLRDELAEDADADYKYKEIKTWNALEKLDAEVFDAVIDFLDRDHHYTEIISDVLEKKCNYNKIVFFEVDSREEDVYFFYVASVVFGDKKQLLDLIAKNYKQLNLSLEEIRDHLVEEMI
jgi:hypothetical protein